VWPRWLTDPLAGKTSLGRAVWLYGFGGSLVYSVIGLLFPETTAGLTVYLALGLALGVLQSVILWRCAPNSRSAFLGRLVRAAVVMGLVLVLIVAYLLFANPDMLLSPNKSLGGSVSFGGVVVGAGRQCASAAPVGRSCAAPQRHRLALHAAAASRRGRRCRPPVAPVRGHVVLTRILRQMTEGTPSSLAQRFRGDAECAPCHCRSADRLLRNTYRSPSRDARDVRGVRGTVWPSYGTR
jgi:hypothetical protein